jgi:hypothetical protein
MRPARKTAVFVLLLTAWLSTIGLISYKSANLSDDLAEHVNNPVRVLHGDMPYRDFWLIHPPGEVFLPAAVYKIGCGVNAVLLLNVSISVLVGLASFWVGQMISGSSVEGALAAILVFFAGVPAEYVGYSYLHLYLLLLLVAAGLMWRYLQNHRRRTLFLAGAAIGFAFLFRLYLTGAAAAALSAIVILEARSRNRPMRETAQFLGMFGCGCLPVVAGATLWLSASVPTMWHAVVVDSLSHAVTRRAVYGHAIIDSWGELNECFDALRQNPLRVGAYLSAAFGFSDLLKSGCMHVLPFLVILLWRRRRRMPAAPLDPPDWMLMYFLLWGGLTFIRPLTRGAPPAQLSQAVTPLYFALVFIVRPLLTRWREANTFGTGAIAWSAIVAIAAVGQVSASITIRQLLTLRYDSYTVSAPYGSVAFNDRQQADELQGLLAAVLGTTDENDHIFVIPWSAPALYALTRRVNPTYYDSTIDLFYRPAEEKQRRVCAMLLKQHAELIIARSDMPGPAWDNIGSASQLSLINDFVEEHFERFSDSGRFSVWRRRKEPVRTGSAAENTDGLGP